MKKGSLNGMENIEVPKHPLHLIEMWKEVEGTQV